MEVHFVNYENILISLPYAIKSVPDSSLLS